MEQIPQGKHQNRAATKSWPIQRVFDLVLVIFLFRLDSPHLADENDHEEKDDFGCSPRARGSSEFIRKKDLKKVLTLESKIQYHGGRFQTDRGLCPGRFFVCSDPNDTKQNTTGTEKEHIHVFIESS